MSNDPNWRAAQAHAKKHLKACAAALIQLQLTPGPIPDGPLRTLIELCRQQAPDKTDGEIQLLAIMLVNQEALAFAVGDAPLRDRPQRAVYRRDAFFADVRDAKGVEGLLCHGAGIPFLRVTHADGSFTDYTVRHDDLHVRILDDDAAFYDRPEAPALDHGPASIGMTTDLGADEES